MRAALALAACALVAACAAPEAPPPPAPQVAAAPPPVTPGGPPTDGRFAGEWRTQEDRGGQCRSPTLRSVEVTLQGGQARIVNRNRGTNGRGTVRPDGVILMSGSMPGGPFTFWGEVRGDRVVGELSNARCVFTADLRRVT